MKDFCAIYVGQKDFQQLLIDSGLYGNLGNVMLPDDRLSMFSYHMQAMVSELGEVLEADKRWKSYRNGRYDREEKLEEIADCFLIMMNVAIYSGYQSFEVEDAILRKIEKNKKRVEQEMANKMKVEENNKKIEEEYKEAEEWEIPNMTNVSRVDIEG